jgi:hypothetical protein
MAFTWSEITVPTSGGADVSDFVWDSGHGLLVAVGGSGLVYTTPDLVTVTKRTAAESNSWRGVAYASTIGASGRLVAVAGDGTHRVMYSDDGGVAWSTASASAANSWQSVVWAASLTLFVAVADTGAADGSTLVMTSSDGITWATHAAINPRQAWSGVTWSSSLGLLVAASADSPSPAGGSVMTSTNGTAWVQRATPVNSYPGGGASSGSNFVTWDAASGLFAYTSLNTGDGVRSVTTSPDGANWTKQTIPTNTDANGGLIGFPGVGLVLFRQGAGNKNVNTSIDGSTWATENTGFGDLFGVSGMIASLSKIVSWGSANTIMLVGASAPPPSPTGALSPTTGPVSGLTPFKIAGTILGAATGVTFAGLAATKVTVPDDGTITGSTPAHAKGLVTVLVQGVTLPPFTFTYVLAGVPQTLGKTNLLPPMPIRAPFKAAS